MFEQYPLYDETAPVPWEMQEGETPKAFSAFNEYKNVHALRRSVRAAANAFYNKASEGQVKTWQIWSQQNSWVARASAWDKYVELEINLELIGQKKEMVKRHLSISKGLQQKAIIALNKLDPDNYEIPPYLILQFLQIGTRLERLSLGEPTEIERHQPPAERDFTTFSNDELRAELTRVVKIVDKVTEGK